MSTFQAYQMSVTCFQYYYTQVDYNNIIISDTINIILCITYIVKLIVSSLQKKMEGTFLQLPVPETTHAHNSTVRLHVQP